MRVGQPSLDDARDAEPHRDDIVSGETFSLAKLQHRVDAGRDTRRGGVRFREYVHETEALPKVMLDDLRVETVAVGAGKTAAAFEDVGGAGEALLGQERRRDSALRRVPRLDA